MNDRENQNRIKAFAYALILNLLKVNPMQKSKDIQTYRVF